MRSLRKTKNNKEDEDLIYIRIEEKAEALF